MSKIIQIVNMIAPCRIDRGAMRNFTETTMVRFSLLVFVTLLSLTLHGTLGKLTVPQNVRRDTDKVSLRILPLGASITWGYLSSDGNGYRKPLRDQLRFEGWEVDMVGSKSNGDMKDNVIILSITKLI